MGGANIIVSKKPICVSKWAFYWAVERQLILCYAYLHHVGLPFLVVDRLAKKNIIHKNKAANNKSKLAKFVKSLAA